MPIIESVDVDFADPRGKLFDRTKFDFTVTRAHNFVAGEYSVTVRRSDGTQMGPAQTLIFNGENTVIDRRAISFVANGKKETRRAAGRRRLAPGRRERICRPRPPPSRRLPANEAEGAPAERPVGRRRRLRLHPVAGRQGPPGFARVRLPRPLAPARLRPRHGRRRSAFSRSRRARGVAFRPASVE